MKKKQFTRVLLVCCISCFVSNVCRADQAEDEAAIRRNDDAYVEAYNKHDAKALAAMWSPEAVYVDPETGEESIGREEIEREFTETFEGLQDAKLEMDVVVDQVSVAQRRHRKWHRSRRPSERAAR